jgi:hypothetical protein
MVQRPLSTADLEKRDRVVRIRAAARRGKTLAEIAALYQTTLETVRHILAAVADTRISDPVHLLHARRPAPGAMPADVQLYWVGFLTAAGRLCGQGAASTLIVTLGDRPQSDMDTFAADLASAHVRYEFCRSSLAGWQLYVRDQNLCKALIPWGIPSDLYGEDPELLDDLPEEFVIPFLRGYVDGNQPGRGKTHNDSASGFALYGTLATLTGINKMLERCWHVKTGTVTHGAHRATLRFPDQQTRAVVWDHVHAYPSRLPFAVTASSPE